MPITYLLFSKKINKFYVGSSRNNDLGVRLTHHNGGSVRSTKNGRPWTSVAVEHFDSYTDARRRELFFKSGVRPEIYQKFGELKNKR